MKKQLNILTKRDKKGRFIKGNIPWTKIYGNSSLKGENNPMKKEENRKKISKAMMGNKNNLGKRLLRKTKEKISKAHKGKKFSQKHRQKLSETKIKLYKEKGNIIGFQKGEKHFGWRGGKSFEPYTIDWTKTLRRAIRERDYYLCQLCHRYGNSIHHIDYNKKNCNPNNLITLCNKCNLKVNFNREYWTKYFYART